MTAPLRSSIVFGVSVMPAASNRSFEYQMPPGSTAMGIAYVLPSSSLALNDPPSGMSFLVSSEIRSVMSRSWFARTIAAILPPPRCRKMSGASPEFSAVWSLPSRSSFWIAWTLMVTSGLSFMKAATVSSQKVLPAPVDALCQKVISTFPPVSPPPPPSSPLQAVRPTAHRSIAVPAAIIVLIFIRAAFLLPFE